IIVRIDEGRLIQQRFSTLEQFRIRRQRILVSAANACKRTVSKNSGNCHQTCLLDKATTRYQSATPQNAAAAELYYQANQFNPPAVIKRGQRSAERQEAKNNC